jgi:Protein of unknown function (DUF2889)
MPLSTPVARREVHQRTVDMKVYARKDGLFDVEAWLVDRKPFDYLRPSSPIPTPAGAPLHDLWVRLTVDSELVVRNIEASKDATPWDICLESPATLQVLIGEKIARGWSAKVKERLRGAAGCTHLMEMLVTLGTPALQGIQATKPRGPLKPETKIDSCFAFGRERAVVQRLWPELHRAQAAPEPPSTD